MQTVDWNGSHPACRPRLSHRRRERGSGPWLLLQLRFSNVPNDNPPIDLPIEPWSRPKPITPRQTIRSGILMSSANLRIPSPVGNGWWHPPPGRGPFRAICYRLCYHVARRRVVQPIDRRLVGDREPPPVEIHRQLDRAVPEHPLDVGGAHAVTEEQAGEAVPETVRGEVRR